MPSKKHPIRQVAEKHSVERPAEQQAGQEAPPRKKLTGRVLIQLDPSASTADIQKKARTRSLRLIPLHALPAGHLNEGLERADGIIFERLKMALVNERNAASLQQLQALRNTPFLSSERERYIYARAGARRELPFRDTAAATWGIQATNVRKSKFSGKDVRLAILDTGFDFTHPDFMGRVIHRKSFVGRQAKDREGHGTHCAGIAVGNRVTTKVWKGKAGVRYGVAPGSRLYIGKILNDQGEGSDGLALAGIEWALEQGCRVISMSFGAQVQKGDRHSVIFEEVAKIALANNCLLIAATGNESDREEGIIAPVNHPANCPSVMAVGALTEHLKVANYSCATVGRSGGQVDIAAPGDDILSAWIDGGHEVESGTSMAAPFVAGVAALLWEEYPDVTAREIWEKLIGQVRKLGLRTVGAGAGLVYVP
ncbi:MAG TPA: S8 family serine peptidase [Puia sp.]|jgi:subtilisin family serine protease|nr:S8 family serine peptidase [Puia sp.]